MDIIQQLELFAEKLGDLCEEAVVVGGCSPALILDIGTAPDLRITDDVDVIVQADDYGKYNKFIEKIRGKGFVEKVGDRIGRYVCGELVVDIIPTEYEVLGFTNKWYSKALTNAVYQKLPSGKRVKTVTSVYFIATKLEAFRDRGGNDLFASEDLEDIVTMLVESTTFEAEFGQADSDVKEYISGQFKNLVSDRDYPHFLSAHLRPDEASQATLPELQRLIERVASRVKLKDETS